MNHQAPWCSGCDQPTHQIRHDLTCSWCDTDLTSTIEEAWQYIDAVHIASICVTQGQPLTKAPT